MYVDNNINYVNFLNLVRTNTKVKKHGTTSKHIYKNLIPTLAYSESLAFWCKHKSLSKL